MKNFEITGNGYEPKGEVMLDGKTIDPLNHPDLVFSGKVAGFCANARLSFLAETNTWKIAGDPTEAAMIVLSKKSVSTATLWNRKYQKFLSAV